MVFGIAPLTPRQAARQSNDPTIRVTVDLVQVDAVVTNSAGRHVVDLSPQDFQVFEDGKPQKITHFSYVSGTALPGGAAPVDLPRQSPLGKPLEAISRPATALRPEEVQRTIVLMADDLALSPDDIPRVRKAMQSFVDGQMQPGDLAAVMTTSGGNGVMQQLTSDRRQLQASINRIHYMPGRTDLTWYEPVTQPTADKLYEKEIKARLGAIRSPALWMGTLGALAYAIGGLREMPGRKAIALFSDGFPQSAGGIVQLANRASVAIYTFDARGLVSFDATALDAGPAAGGIRSAHNREAPYRASQTSLDELARGTGGVFFHDNNNLGRDLASALDDIRAYYLIGYQPNREDFDKVRGEAQFHKIEVKVLRAGLRVRSRNGFVGIPDQPAVLEDAARKSGKEELRKALFSPFHTNGFPVQLSAFYSAAARKDSKTGRRPTVLRAMLAIDARGVKFSDAPEGKKQLDLDIVAAAYGAANEAVASSDRTFHVAMAPDEMNRTVASGLMYGFEIEILQPGPYQLRVAAWDANSERVASATTFVEIPDFNRKGLALSSVQLYDSDAKRNEELTRAGVIGAGSAVTRVFEPGAVVKYDCTVYGSLIESQTGKPEIEVAVDLFRGPEQIYHGQPAPLAITGGNSPASIHATGQIMLPATLPPGDYALELTVFDRLEKKQPQGATQWAGFTLVK
jgi:VWFA-related protein